MNKLISTIYWSYFLAYNVYNWTPEDVGQWLESRSLSEYKDSFIRNEIRGTELLTLDKGDLQDLGVTKVGHLKRIQQGIKELNNRMTAYDKSLVKGHKGETADRD
uniref:Diacylglycerol kinase delta n=1 Tax=Magallana gigas TaxID=29159 RepID=K1P6N2_MAGGI